MIKNPESYPRGRSGIKTTCRVVVICDKCTKEWETQYSNYKSKKSTIDLCISCKNKFGITGMLGKKHSEKTKSIFRSNCGDKNPFYKKTHSSLQKDKWSKERRGKKCRLSPMPQDEKAHRSKKTREYWNALTEEERIHRLSLMDFSAMQKRLLCNGGRYSKLHLKVKEAMTLMDIVGFQSEVQIGDFVYDEVNKNNKTIVEINGDYWHANPMHYRDSDVIAYPKGFETALSVWNKDKIKIDRASKLGYEILIIWESDVKSGKYLELLKELI